MWQLVSNYLDLKLLITKVKSLEILIVNNHSEYKYLDYLSFSHLRLFYSFSNYATVQ